MTEFAPVMSVIPAPNMLSPKEERLVFEAKVELSIQHDLDNFQVQASVALLNGNNVVLIAPCGHGKLLVLYLALQMLCKSKNMHNGMCICLQPLNNILNEKTNNNPPIQTTFLAMMGDGVKYGQ